VAYIYECTHHTHKGSNSDWPIGSGVVEAACKTVVSARFKQSGMHWSRTGADALLLFRTALLSGRIDALGEHILQKRKHLNAA